MVWIKICGITDYFDAQGVVEAGADALGFVFAPSSRRVEREKARMIIKKLPQKVEKIGIFVNEEPEDVLEIAKYCGLTGLQLHGEESPEYCSFLLNYSFNVIKVFRVWDCLNQPEIEAYLQKRCINRILLDTYIPGKRGGTGHTFVWGSISGFEWQGLSVIIAGGLNVENVLTVIEQVHPFGVDVSSGVEKYPGRKDLGKVKEFLKKVRKL